MAKQSKYDSQHTSNIGRYARQIEQLYDTAAMEAAAITAVVHSFNPDKPFSFADYPATKARIDKLLAKLSRNIQSVIINGIKAEWEVSNIKNDELVRASIGKVWTGKRGASHIVNNSKRYFQHNEPARDAFIARKEAGLSLSDRVWRYTDQFKSEIEMGLDLGIREGKDAETIGRDLRQYLRQPDKLFRRVRDEHGQLQLSRRAAAYNPGAGVYRSSRMNALRTARTETNIAYRAADHTRWEQLDFVVGFEVRRSNNPYECSVCQSLVGKYPKDFKFTGWHPQCRCYAIPILQTEEEFEAANKAFLEGGELTGESGNTVRDVPAGYNEWIEANRERAKGWGSMPYFVKDNPQYVQGFEVNTYTQAERKFTRAGRTNEAMNVSLGTYLSAKYPNVPNTEVAAIFHYTQGEGAAYRQLNNQLRKDKPLSEFNQAFSELLTSGLEKMPKYKGQVYRGLRLNKTQLRDWLATAENGGQKTLKGFTSASQLRSVAEEFTLKGKPKPNETAVILKIRSKTGRSISSISEFNGIFAQQNQREILFNKGSQFKVVRSYPSDGAIIFELIEL
jgi:hypothetical protein